MVISRILQRICDLADKHDALVMVDDSHAVGFMGKTGRGTHEFCGVMGRIDILTGTLGKALGGASGGYTSGRREIVELLRQRSRPYLFSNTLAPSIAGASLKVLEMLSQSTALRDKLEDNTRFFREEMTRRGFSILPGTHPICPIMLGDAALAARFADAAVGQGRLRDRIFLSRRAARKGAHSDANLGRPFARGPRIRGRGFYAVKQELGL